jgi:ABC-type antimicrobial peptide transport system permease subunit
MAMKATTYVFRGLKKSKRRYILGALSIVLSTTIMISIGVVFAGGQQEFRGFFERAYAYDFEIRAQNNGQNISYLDGDALVHNVSGIQGVESAHPLLATIMFVRSPDTGNNRPILVYGTDQSYKSGKQVSLKGNYDLSSGKIVLTKSAAAKFNASVGSTLVLQNQFVSTPSNLSVDVSGIVELEGRFPPQVGEYGVVDFSFLGAGLNITGKATSVLVLVDPSLYDFGNPSDPTKGAFEVGDRMALQLGPAFTVTSQKGFIIQQSVQGTSFFGIMLYVFTAFFPAVAGIMVASILNLSVEDKAHDLGVLRLMGARRDVVARIVLMELALIIAAGLPIGVILGLALPFTFLGGILSSANAMAIAQTIVVQVGITIGVLLIFAIQPLQKALRTNPIDAVRMTRSLGTLSFRTDSGIDRRIPLSGILVFLAVGYSTLVIPYILIFSSGLEIVFYILISIMVMLVCLCIGMLGFATTIERGMIAAIGPITPKVNKLARRSVARYARRNLSTNIIFGVVVAILIFFTSLISTVRGSIEDTARYESGADVRVRSAFEISEIQLGQIQAIPGVGAVAGVGEGALAELAGLVGPSGDEVSIYPVDSRFASASYVSGNDFYQGQPEDLDLANGSVIISRATATALNVKTGDVLRAEKADRRSFLTVKAVLNELPGFPFEVSQTKGLAFGQAAFVSFEQYSYLTNKTIPGKLYTSLFIKVAAGSNPNKVGKEVGTRFADLEGFRVDITAENIKQVVTATAFLDVIFSAVLLGMMMVAVFSLMSNLYASIKEREFEIGVLRAVGFRRAQILSSLMTEGLAVAFGSVILGILTGLIVGYMMVWFIGLISALGWRFLLPWDIITLVLAVTLVTSALGIYSTSRMVTRKDLIDLLKRAE